MKIIGGLVIKDGIEYVKKYMDKMNNVVDEIIVVDNSNDGSSEIINQYKKVTYHLRQHNIQKTRGRCGHDDYKMIYELALKRFGDWVFVVDIDEEIDDKLTYETLHNLCKDCKEDTISFEIYEMWEDKNHYITNRMVHRIYRLLPDLSFVEGMHSSPIPENYNKPGRYSCFRIKHFGHMKKEDRDKKRNEWELKSDEKLNKDEIEAVWFDEERADKLIKECNF